MAASLTFAYDGNFRFDVEDPAWSRLIERWGLGPVRYDDMAGRLVTVAAYEHQIDAVVDGRVDATMVQEDVWRRHPDYAQTTRVIARKENLPTPVVIIDSSSDAGLKRNLDEVVFSHRPPLTPDTLFAGFVPFRSEQVEEFFAASERAVPALE